MYIIYKVYIGIYMFRNQLEVFKSIIKVYSHLKGLLHKFIKVNKIILRFYKGM